MTRLYCNARWLLALAAWLVHFNAVVEHGLPLWTLGPSGVALLVWHVRATNAELDR